MSNFPAKFTEISSNRSTLRVLLVEDDPVMQLGLKHLLSTDSRFQIVGQVGDGYSAIEAAQTLEPDLVVMDIGLPQLDGIAATQQIKANQPSVHVIMLTSHSTEHETIAALSSGADAYCIKGTNVDRLFAAIATVQDGTIYLDPQIVQHVLDQLKPATSSLPKPNAPIVQLSERELQVLKLMVEGYSNPEIAAELYLSLSTVKTHIRSIMNKLSVDDRVQAAVVALRAGIV